MCELLLQENADPSDCNRYGDHLLAVLISKIEQSDDLEQGVKLMDLLGRYGPFAEACSIMQYKRPRGSDRAPTSLIHSAIARHWSGLLTHVPQLLERLITRGVDLEATDRQGNTPLLYIVFYLSLKLLHAATMNMINAELLLANMGKGSPICYLCNRPPDPSLRDAPFDEFFSDVVDELGCGTHMIMNNHDEMEECLRIHEEDSTHLLDYHPLEMSPETLKERSWRRHVAWRLWERGGCWIFESLFT
ncbi:hypothetical protein QBC44DRAFT_397199 [Cladorrhinum sp. PSN332]|nr:hypothetical protein QBC44DRAFT_397199 [Cladorrhinum sp. PSN332]